MAARSMKIILTGIDSEPPLIHYVLSYNIYFAKIYYSYVKFSKICELKPIYLSFEKMLRDTWVIWQLEELLWSHC